MRHLLAFVCTICLYLGFLYLSNSMSFELYSLKKEELDWEPTQSLILVQLAQLQRQIVVKVLCL
jgi:hypothetical protein